MNKARAFRSPSRTFGGNLKEDDPDMKERRGIARELPKTRGRCQMCFGHDRELRMLFIGDFIGWACEECRRQLRESVERQFCATTEHTEPGE